jgi:hypothetical protein
MFDDAPEPEFEWFDPVTVFVLVVICLGIGGVVWLRLWIDGWWKDLR